MVMLAILTDVDMGTVPKETEPVRVGFLARLPSPPKKKKTYCNYLQLIALSQIRPHHTLLGPSPNMGIRFCNDEVNPKGQTAERHLLAANHVNARKRALRTSVNDDGEETDDDAAAVLGIRFPLSANPDRR